MGFSSDVFSLGVVLFELLSGSPANGDGTIRSLPLKPSSSVNANTIKLAGISISSSQLKNKLVPSIDLVVEKATAERLEDRYKSANEMGSDIHRLLTRQPVLPPNKKFGPTPMLKWVIATALILAICFSLGWVVNHQSSALAKKLLEDNSATLSATESNGALLLPAQDILAALHDEEPDRKPLPLNGSSGSPEQSSDSESPNATDSVTASTEPGFYDYPNLRLRPFDSKLRGTLTQEETLSAEETLKAMVTSNADQDVIAKMDKFQRLNLLVKCNLNMGRTSEARNWQSKFMRAVVNQHGKHGSPYLAALTMQAKLQRASFRAKDAWLSCDQAIGIAKDCLRKDVVDSEVYSVAGTLRVNAGQFVEASKFFEKDFQLCQEVYPDPNSKTLLICTNLIATKAKAFPDDAEKLKPLAEEMAETIQACQAKGRSVDAIFLNARIQLIGIQALLQDPQAITQSKEVRRVLLRNLIQFSKTPELALRARSSQACVYACFEETKLAKRELKFFYKSYEEFSKLNLRPFWRFATHCVKVKKIQFAENLLNELEMETSNYSARTTMIHFALSELDRKNDPRASIKHLNLIASHSPNPSFQSRALRAIAATADEEKLPEVRDQAIKQMNELFPNKLARESVRRDFVELLTRYQRGEVSAELAVQVGPTVVESGLSEQENLGQTYLRQKILADAHFEVGDLVKARKGFESCYWQLKRMPDDVPFNNSILSSCIENLLKIANDD